jgi:mono/diheme cytochrome c family protein
MSPATVHYSLKRLALRAAAIAAGVLLVAASATAIYVARTWNRTYDAPLPDVHATADPAVIARGEYLVFGPSHCVECHTTAEETADAANAGRRPRLTGGRRFAAAPLGAIYSRNLTPDRETGIGRYSDPQIARMLRYSVRPDGHASVQLLMPFGSMSDEDLTAIVSYLRAQQPIRNVVPANEWSLVGKVVKSFAPPFKPREHVDPPARSPKGPTKERGEYLAKSVGNCISCHTQFNPVTLARVAPEFAGGNEMEPDAKPGVDQAIWFRTPNITPAAGSALNKFPDRETFVARFQRGGRHYEGSPMPWESYGHMNEEDLSALWAFLHSLQPQQGPTGDPQFKKVG